MMYTGCEQLKISTENCQLVMEDGESKVGEDVNIAKLKDTNLVLLETGPRCPSDRPKPVPGSSATTLSPNQGSPNPGSPLIGLRKPRPRPQGTSKIFTRIAIIARTMLSQDICSSVRLSVYVCLSICLSHADILSKRLDISSIIFTGMQGRN